MGVKARISQELVVDVSELDDEKLQHWITVLCNEEREIDDKIRLEYDTYRDSGIKNSGWLRKAEVALKARRTAVVALESERKRRNREKTDRLHRERMDMAASPYFQFVNMLKKRMEYADFLKLWQEACDRAETAGKAQNGKAV
jgi:hypothetical protein